MLNLLKVFRAPDAQPGPASGGAAEPNRRRRKGVLPASDAQLAELASYAANTWLNEGWLTLRYTNAATLSARAVEYKTAIANRRQAGGNRPTNAIRIEQLDEEINENLYRVKGLLTDKYDRKIAPAYYPKMGIEKRRQAFILPRERTRRAAALAQLVKGLTDEGFITTATAYPFGTGFWQPIADEYAQLIKELTDDTGAISDAVGEKDLLRDEIERILRSISQVLSGNFPDAKEYKAQLRLWGFQRESY